jgi:putative DNA primase/helicase
MTSPEDVRPEDLDVPIETVDNVVSPREVRPPGDPYPNAKQFIAERYNHAERPRLLAHGGSFYTWAETHWAEVEDAALRGELYEYFNDAAYWKPGTPGTPPTLEPFQPTRNKIADLTQALQASVHLDRAIIPPGWLDDVGADGYVSCANGILHVPTRKLHNHSPRFYTHHSVPFDFNANAPTPKRWLRFLAEVFNDDPETIRALQQMFGYILAGGTKLQKMFLLIGCHRSGKGTIARILTALIGKHNVAGATLASLATNFGLQPLIGKPLCIISDARIGESSSIIIERLLTITGEDLLTVDRKYREAWTGTLPTRLLVLSNELPQLGDASGALASRFIVTLATQCFLGREDPGLTVELLTELPGILNWALDGVDDLTAAGSLLQPAASEDMIREMEDLSSPINAFVRDICVMGAEHQVRCEVLYQAWRDWCEANGLKPGSTQVFGRDLRAARPGLRVRRPRDDDGVRRVRFYQGVDIAPRH